MARREVNLFQAALGMTLFATIAMPIVPDGPSLLDVLLQVARDNPLGALTMLLMFGSPQLFGLAVGIAGLTREDAVARAAVTSMVALMQGMLVMLGVGIVGGNVVAPVGLFGFAIVTGLYLPYASGEAAASTRGHLSLRWWVRWGALLVAGFGLWLRLQALAGVPIGLAIDVAIAAAVVLLASLAPRDPQVSDEAG